MDPVLADLTDAIAALRGDAEIDLIVTIGSEAPYVVRITDGGAAIIAAADPERTVTLTVTDSGAAAVRAGSANAQQLLHTGELRIGGRIDVLQAQAAALAALQRDDAS